MPDRPSQSVGWSPILRSVAAHGLADTTATLPTGPLAAQEWASLLRDAGHHRILGLLAACVEDGALAVTESQYSEVAEAHAATMTRVLDVEIAALDAIALLERAGVGVRVLKGMAVAHLDMADPSQREFRDVDLLVEPAAFAHASAVLAAAGLPRDLPERRRGFDRRFGKDATHYAKFQVEIDLHRTLALGAFGLALDPAALWDAGQPFELGGRRLRALRPEARLVHACYSAVLGDRQPHLATVRDIAQLAGRNDLDAGDVIRLAARCRGEAVVARALRLAGGSLGVADALAAPPWPGTRAETPWERLSMASYECYGGTNTSALLSGVMGLRSFRERSSYLAALVFPERSYVRARRRAGRPSEWTQGLRELLRRAREAGHLSFVRRK